MKVRKGDLVWSTAKNVGATNLPSDTPVRPWLATVVAVDRSGWVYLAKSADSTAVVAVESDQLYAEERPARQAYADWLEERLEEMTRGLDELAKEHAWATSAPISTTRTADNR